MQLRARQLKAGQQFTTRATGRKGVAMGNSTDSYGSVQVALSLVDNKEYPDHRLIDRERVEVKVLHPYVIVEIEETEEVR